MHKLIILVLLTALLASCSNIQQEQYQRVSSQAATPLILCSTVANPAGNGAYTNPTGNPIGGGVGYNNILSTGTVTVTTATQLMNELNNHVSGQAKTVFIPANADIDLTTDRANTVNNNPIRLKPGLILASNRGKNGSLGGIIRISQITNPNNPALFVVGNNVRITGLRIQGPFTAVGDDMGSAATTKLIGIRSDPSWNPGNFEIDNNELYGWGFAAISPYEGIGYIHHNYIHNNQRYGLGYGVEIRDNGKACIEANLFDKNRHAIATTGLRNNGLYQQGYEARFNLTVHAIENSTAYGTTRLHDFDAHGECEVNTTSTSPYASHTIKIHHNTFLSTHNQATILVRGKPESGVWVENNQIADLVSSTTQGQGFVRQTPPSFCQGRTIDYASVDSTLVPTPGTNGTNTHSFTSTVFYTSRSTGNTFEDWKPIAAHNYNLNQLAFKDFNGDGVTDILRTDGTSWYISYGGNANWAFVKTSAYTLGNIGFGDFNGDGRTDTFVIAGNVWQVTYTPASGSFGNWQNLATVDATYSLSELAFGDFTGDNKTDVLKTTGTQWLVASYESGWTWQLFNTSVYTLASGKLGLGDFNGLGKTDIFLSEAFTSNTTWQYAPSEGTNHAWVTLKTFTTSYPLSSLALADFSGNGKTDIFQSNVSGTGATATTTWSISIDGTGNWTTFKTFTGNASSFPTNSPYPLSGLGFGNFDGDNKIDVFRVGGL
jgi:hypothetical protein